MIELSAPIESSDTARPACLRTELDDIPTSTVLTITGWGTISAASKNYCFLLSYKL